MSDAGGHVPDSPVGQEAIEAAQNANFAEAILSGDGKPKPREVARIAVEAAYPLIARACAQQIAEAITEKAEWRRQQGKPRLAGRDWAEFVVSYAEREWPNGE